MGPNILCKPDSDNNIYDSSDPTKRSYIGKHPGTAFMEMQFYPLGRQSSVVTPTRWCAALNIDSVSENENTGLGNNDACGGAIEYVNFAYIQTDGIPFPAGSPSPLGPFVSTKQANTLFMNSGDELVSERFQDTAHGLKVVVDDRTTGQSGFMVASAANGFAELMYRPERNQLMISRPTISLTISTPCTPPRPSTLECRGQLIPTTSPSPTKSGTLSIATRLTQRVEVALTHGINDSRRYGC